MRVYNSQWAYDEATEPPLDDYRESYQFAEFCEYVTIELLAGRDCAGMDSQVMVADLELNQKGYQWALEWVCSRVTEDQLKEWLEC